MTKLRLNCDGEKPADADSCPECGTPLTGILTVGSTGGPTNSAEIRDTRNGRAASTPR
jgi:hypothetical protein